MGRMPLDRQARESSRQPDVGALVHFDPRAEYARGHVAVIDQQPAPEDRKRSKAVAITSPFHASDMIFLGDQARRCKFRRAGGR